MTHCNKHWSRRVLIGLGVMMVLCLWLKFFTYHVSLYRDDLGAGIAVRPWPSTMDRVTVHREQLHRHTFLFFQDTDHSYVWQGFYQWFKRGGCTLIIIILASIMTLLVWTGLKRRFNQPTHIMNRRTTKVLMLSGALTMATLWIKFFTYYVFIAEDLAGAGIAVRMTPLATGHVGIHDSELGHHCLLLYDNRGHSYVWDEPYLWFIDKGWPYITAALVTVMVITGLVSVIRKHRVGGQAIPQ